jgi:cyanophycinase
MSKLIDSDQPEAIGLTLGSNQGEQPDLGFEFKLTRATDSVGYQSSVTEAYSVYNMRLDVRPIVVRHPLYQYVDEPASGRSETAAMASN